MKYDEFGTYLGGYDKKFIKEKVKEYINKIKEDYYLRIRNIKIREEK